MAEEFRINSTAIEDKINQLLPSQGGQGAGIDFSASTMVIPVVNLTEAAEGSSLRADIQTSFSLNAITSFAVHNATTTIITTTGYFRVFGVICANNPTGGHNNLISITDGISSKDIIKYTLAGIGGGAIATAFSPFDFNVFVEAGHSVVISAASTDFINGNSRQIADISGNLINP